MTDLLTRLQQALGERYRIERELGSGGTGVVFLAEDLKHRRQVAIKVLRPEIGQSLGADRFLREIQISARLNHPHILPLIDSGEAEGLLYYVMFFVEGESLRARIDRERQLPIEDAVRIAREVAEGIGHAHAAGIIHRDIKPENILLSAGHALVCDFGIARAIGEAGGDKLTQAGFVMGTPAYMSPEQATGDAMGPRSDIYSLASVLYEMLVGTVPFHGATPQAMLARKAVEELPSLRIVRDTVPEHVERAVGRAMARVPADRFETAEEFGRALQDPALTRPNGLERAWDAGRRLRTLIGGGAVVLVGGLGLLLLGRTDAPPAPLRTTFSQVTAQPGVEDGPSLSPDGAWVVYAGDNGRDRDIFLRSIGGQRPINLTQDSPDDDHSPAFSPDGDRIAFRSSRDGGGLFVMGRTGEAVRRVTDRGHSPTWSPDGSRLAYVMEDVGLLPLNLETEVRGLWTVDLSSGETRQLVDRDAVLPDWSPDGRWIAFTGRGVGSHIWLVSSDGGEPRALTTGGENDWSSAWSPDGRYVYFSSDRGGSMNLWRLRVDPDSGEPVGQPEPLTTPSAFVAHPSVSGDGTRIAYASVLTTQNIEKATLDTAAWRLVDPVPLTTGSRQWSSPDPSPDGQWVAFYSRDLPEGDLYVVRGDGTGLRQLTGDSAIDRVPRWSPDGTRLAYFSNRDSDRLQTWIIGADGSGHRRLTFGEGAAVGGWSPDGRSMVINNFPSGGLILDPSLDWEDQRLERITADSSWGVLVANDWSRDGQKLAVMIGYTDEGVGMYDLTTRTPVRLTDFGQWPVWLPDSRHMLFVSGAKGFYVVDSETLDVRTVYSVTRDVLGPPRVTADGSTVVYSRRVTEGDIWLVTIQ